jgi:class 3 adenylate cyclase/DNA-binding beta-propeller fold protein YncE
MAGKTVRRRLATVLFLDIVGSTTIASELGDARWRAVLIQFRRVVRRELKRYDGREQDTAGDGFSSTFDEPANALRCAAAIATAVQELGLDVRAGVHTGECAQIDGKAGGIAVHIAARTMSLAGAAEVVTTGTTKDLVVGSQASFDEAGTHELKGVEGAWRVHKLRSIEVELPSPLDPGVAAARLQAVAARREPRRRWQLVAVAAGAILAVLLAFEIVRITGADAAPPTLVRLDPGTGRVVATVRDGQIGCGPCGPNLWADGGTLWQRTGDDGGTIAIRSLATGKVIRTIALSPTRTGVTIGFGAAWVVEPGVVSSTTPPVGHVDRIDGLSGRVTASVVVHGDLKRGAIVTGDDAVWVLDQDAVLTRIDPASNRVSGRFATGALETSLFATGAGFVWICECTNNHAIVRYDPVTRRSKRMPIPRFPQAPRGSDQVFYPAQTFIAGMDPGTGTLWFLGGESGLVPVVPNGRQGPPSVGLSGEPVQATVATGSVWTAASTVVNRVTAATGERKVFTLPKGMNGTGVAIDPATNTVWVGNSTAAGTD